MRLGLSSLLPLATEFDEDGAQNRTQQNVVECQDPLSFEAN